MLVDEVRSPYEYLAMLHFRRVLCAFWVLTGVAVSARVHALDVPDTDIRPLPCRPTIACTADIVPPGTVELETGYLYRRLGNHANQHSVPFLLKLTAFEWLQFQFGSNGPTFESQPSRARFFDDVMLGAKFHILDQTTSVPSVALSALASLPGSPADGYVRTYDALFTGYITKDIGWLHADLNLGFDVWRVENAALKQPWAALALSVPLPKDFGAMIEFYYFANAAPIAPRDGGTLVAVSYAPAHWVMFDAGFDVGLVQASRAFSLFVGATIIPVDLWETRAEERARLARLTHNER